MRRPARTLGTAQAIEDTPIAAINTTPLIDVMLVLLIMFVITIPVATNSIDLELPSTEGTPPVKVDLVKNKVVVTPDGRILWNGAQLDSAALSDALRATTRMSPEPELQFQPDAQAGYELSARVLQAIKAAEVTRFGIVGNEQFASFDK
ncbi:biopolymer transporter ExbD [Novosphingobium sp. AP12]|uniref:ExbD/TolR family protein n=1 Tax=Novosphingobium sp. AP12 TaxID=1144305 RepID=UPI000271E7F8|nr:biopolymer transporter ExbD [Novosphingobium sp. AP12]EJL21806.1 biopolymer transport protein [Novosphingobium sp. AP12]